MSDFRPSSSSHSRFASGVRLGGGGTGGGGRSPWIFIGVGAAVVPAVVVILWAVLCKETGPARTLDGCQSDAACDSGRFCAAGGCIVLLSSEHRGIWRDEIAAQRAPSGNWQPVSEPGDRLLSENVCPLPTRTMPEARSDKIRVEKSARVVEVSADGIVEHFQQKVRGSIWVDVVPFPVGEAGSAAFVHICGTEGTSGVRRRETKTGPILDVLLKSAVPAEKSVVAGVSFRTAAPPPDENGVSTLLIRPAPPRFAGMQQHTAVVFPLGTEVLSVSGPMPSRQKLLNGHVLYDFTHSANTASVALTYRLRPRAVPPVKLTTEPL